jgi:hypothetical protein
MATVAEGKTRADAESVLTDDQIATYRRDGLVKVDVRRILGDEAFERMREAFLYAEADDYRAHPGTDPYPATVLYREIHKSYPALAEFALSPQLGAVAAQLIGCDHVRLFGDETFTKLPGMPMTIWHQDSSTLPFDKPDFLTLWMAIDDVDQEMGAMRYVPGSHTVGNVLVTRTENLKAGQMGEPDDLATLLPDEHKAFADGVVNRPLRAGEGMIHHGALMHGAAPNSSDRKRRAYAMTIISADIRYSGKPHWPTDELGLTPGEVIDHPEVPQFY